MTDGDGTAVDVEQVVGDAKFVTAVQGLHGESLAGRLERQNILNANSICLWLKPLLETLSPKPTLHIIEGGDHSFKLLKRIDRSEQSVFDEVVQASADWINQKN